MLSYQHGYHAGNFADVIKHLALTRILLYLTQKDKPLFYLETHAGRGLYDLQDKKALKTLEFQQGIALLWSQRQKLPAVFDPYIQAISGLNQEGALRYYPGSPYLADHGLRASDRLYLCELHPREFTALETMRSRLRKVHLSNTDGIASLKALLPPPEKRGLIFIDPAYEVKEEYKTIPLAIKEAAFHFSSGVFCLWYPVVNRRLTDQLLKRLETIGSSNVLHLEFNLHKSQPEGMSGCGLWIINPPFTLAKEMEAALKVLKGHFNPGFSAYVLRQI
jgi:23S rRNA (adenine2030-N6)-methyltransferase